MYCRARLVNAVTCACSHASSRPSSLARIAATAGAIRIADRAFRNSALVRRASTSSTDRASSLRAAQTTSAPVYGSASSSGAARAGSDSPSAMMAGASEP